MRMPHISRHCEKKIEDTAAGHRALLLRRLLIDRNVTMTRRADKSTSFSSCRG
jgi:hypothetical protein